jgi:tryptophanyl-tRNA synthetase
LEDDDELAEIKRKYGKGELLSGEVKKILSDILVTYVSDF